MTFAASTPTSRCCCAGLSTMRGECRRRSDPCPSGADLPPANPALGTARRQYLGVVSEDTWAGLADKFVDDAYASVKGHVRTYVLHQHLLEHLPAPPAPVLDVGGGAGHQSFPLAQAGYDVTLLDPSPAMLAQAGERLERLPA